LLPIVRTEGVKGLYRGYTISAICTPLFSTLYFPMYETFKIKFHQKFEWDENSFKLYSLSASLAGVTCNVITNPFWMVRTRMQAEAFRSSCEVSYHEKYPHNILKAMQMIAREEGIRALYQGLTASFVGVIHPLIYFPLYEKSKVYLKQNVQVN
jgi:hypothetical protein